MCASTRFFVSCTRNQFQCIAAIEGRWSQTRKSSGALRSTVALPKCCHSGYEHDQELRNTNV